MVCIGTRRSSGIVRSRLRVPSGSTLPLLLLSTWATWSTTSPTCMPLCRLDQATQQAPGRPSIPRPSAGRMRSHRYRSSSPTRHSALLVRMGLLSRTRQRHAARRLLFVFHGTLLWSPRTHHGKGVLMLIDCAIGSDGTNPRTAMNEAAASSPTERSRRRRRTANWRPRTAPAAPL